MDINVADLTLHVDEDIPEARRQQLELAFRQRDGVVSVHNSSSTPHLWVLGYNPEKVQSYELIDIVNYNGLHGELIGL